LSDPNRPFQSMRSGSFPQGIVFDTDMPSQSRDIWHAWTTSPTGVAAENFAMIGTPAAFDSRKAPSTLSTSATSLSVGRLTFGQEKLTCSPTTMLEPTWRQNSWKRRAKPSASASLPSGVDCTDMKEMKARRTPSRANVSLHFANRASAPGPDSPTELSVTPARGLTNIHGGFHWAGVKSSFKGMLPGRGHSVVVFATNSDPGQRSPRGHHGLWNQ